MKLPHIRHDNDLGFDDTSYRCDPIIWIRPTFTSSRYSKWLKEVKKINTTEEYLKQVTIINENTF
jgi:hypothetical protein